MKVTLEPIDTTVRVMLGDVKSGPAASKALAAFAWQEFAKAASHNQRALGYLPEHETWVDGRKGAQPESVKPDGRIVFEFELSDDTIEWIAAMLELHSPTGPPARGHTPKITSGSPMVRSSTHMAGCRPLTATSR